MTSSLEFSLSVSIREPCRLDGFDFYWQIPRLAAWQFKFLFVFSLSLLSCLSLVSLTSHALKYSQFYLFMSLPTHVSTLYVIILYLWHQLLRKIDLECLILVDILSNRQRRGRGSKSREQHVERLVSWPLENKKRASIHSDVFQLLGMLVATLTL